MLGVVTVLLLNSGITPGRNLFEASRAYTLPPTPHTLIYRAPIMRKRNGLRQGCWLLGVHFFAISFARLGEASLRDSPYCDTSGRNGSCHTQALLHY